MHIPPLSDEVQAEIVSLHKSGMSQNKIAEKLGLSRSGVQNAIKRAARRGEFGPIEPLPGFEIARTAQRLDKSGQVIGQSVEQKPERGGAFNIPEGMGLTGVSAYVGSDGRVTGQWVKAGPKRATPEEIEDQFRKAVEAYRGYARLPPAPLECDDNRKSYYTLADLHFGMRSWGKETGEDWDCDIAERVFHREFGKLIHKTPASKRAVLLGLGDFFHADNFDNQTSRSKHPLDVDGRFPDVQWRGALLLRMAIEMLAAKHELVTVRILPGNHDDHAAYHLAHKMRAFFVDHPRITVDADNSPHWVDLFGVTMLAAGHGDQAKAENAGAIMASYWPEHWGASKFRHYYSAHKHHFQKGGTGGGATWEIIEPLIPLDAYSHRHGYKGGRSLVCDTYHITDGPESRHRVNIIPEKQRSQVAA